MCYVVLNTLFVCSMYDIRILCTFELRYFQLTWCLLPFMSFFGIFEIHPSTMFYHRPNPTPLEGRDTSESNNEPFDYKRAQQQATSNKQQAQATVAVARTLQIQNTCTIGIKCLLSVVRYHRTDRRERGAKYCPSPNSTCIWHLVSVHVHVHVHVGRNPIKEDV